jgi:hypothetical protein
MGSIISRYKNSFKYNRIQDDYYSNEELAFILIKNFRDMRSRYILLIEQTLKTNIIKNYPRYFSKNIKLSLVHYTDNWKKLKNKNSGIYLVIGEITKENICIYRQLVYIKNNKISLVEKKIINKKVNPKNILK